MKTIFVIKIMTYLIFLENHGKKATRFCDNFSYWSGFVTLEQKFPTFFDSWHP